jgi:hypothetical protein
MRARTIQREDRALGKIVFDKQARSHLGTERRI